jgi:hypothetical protein
MDLAATFSKINSRHIIILFLLAALGISLQTYFAGHPPYTRYNNFVIFRQSFGHLVHNQNLYIFYPAENYDLFKYSPSFAFLMGIFYILPRFVGLILFNLLNAGIFIIAVRRLRFTDTQLKYIFLYVLLEACISITSAQTNLLMAGLIILGFSFLEEEKMSAAALCIVLSFFIKIFGIVAFALWFLYPKKIKFILYTIMWFVIITALPLLIVSKNDLLFQYRQWWALLISDHDSSYGASVIGLLHSWFSLNISKEWMLIAAGILFLLPFLKYSYYRIYHFRLQILASILIWIVIFNHKAESPTYIIAMAGVAIWYFSQPPTRINKTLLWLCLIFTSFSSTDLITPGRIINHFVEPYAIKAVFCTIIWLKLLVDLMGDKNRFSYLRGQPGTNTTC